MAFKNNTNAGRVAKMIDLLRLIEKSASSNRAAPSEIAKMLTPLAETLRPYLPSSCTETLATAPDSPLGRLTPGERASLLLADGASLDQHRHDSPY
ncbi:hypothetical protein [Jannaschia aquimarina]|uniref:Uncharacterized protein n=1 Tax=Jannaschia aquimarina TaxID=935700 RepID=A0A0D1D2T3_9RHOB|nr:hypothetical protein [Jannaschia aquimarina]KIT14398.1 hypothetical protein jaqu_38860 [Jannaschia aquimarina]SNT42194.1 hypothetical protein SAMN05421775_11822 [Jannaschia aquimarina]